MDDAAVRESLLAYARHRAGKSQAQLAAELDIPRSTLAMIEAGHRQLDIQTATAAAKALSTPAEPVTAANLVAASVAGAGTAARRRALKAALGAVADVLRDPAASPVERAAARELGEDLLEAASLDLGDTDATDAATKSAEAGEDEVDPYPRDARGRRLHPAEHERDAVGRSRKGIGDEDRYARDAHGRRR